MVVKQEHYDMIESYLHKIDPKLEEHKKLYVPNKPYLFDSYNGPFFPKIFVDEVNHSKIEALCYIDENVGNGYGLISGGAFLALSDYFGTAVGFLDGSICVTKEVKTSFLKPGKLKNVYFIRTLKVENTTSRVEIFNMRDELICTSTIIFKKIKSKL